MSIDTGARDYLSERQLAGLRQGTGATYLNIGIALAALVAVHETPSPIPLAGSAAGRPSSLRRSAN